MGRSLIVGFGLLGLALVSAACSTFQRAESARRAETELVGISAAQLLSCAGAPNRQATSGGVEVLTYVVQTQAGIHEGTGGRTSFCEATFVVEGGRVTRVSYRDESGGLLTKGEHCGYIVQNCLQ